MTEKQFVGLLNPLQQVAQLQQQTYNTLTDIEQTTFDTKVAVQYQLKEQRSQSKTITEIKNILSPLKDIKDITISSQTVSNLTTSVTNLGEILKEQTNKLDQQTTILGKIKESLENQSQGESSEGKKGSGALASLTGSGIAPFVIGGIAAGVLAASGFFSMIPKVGAAQVAVAISVALTLKIIAPVMKEITEALVGGGFMERVAGGLAGSSSPDLSPKEMLSAVGGAALAIVGMAAAITSASIVFQAIVPVSPKQLATAALIGASLIPIAFAFRLAISGIGKDTGPDEIAYATLSLIGIAFAISSIANIWANQMPSSFPPLPPLSWIAKSGLALALFSGSMALLIKSVDGASYNDLLIAAGAMALTAGAIVATAYMFQFLPDTYKAPPLKWSALSGLAVLAFAGPFALLAYTIGGQSADDLLKSSIAIGIVALSIVATSWIFSYLSGSYSAPPLWWSLQAGTALLAFGTSMSLMAIMIQKGGVGLKSIGYGLLAMVASSIAVLAVSWIFQLLPGSYYAPPIEWSTKIALGLGIFTAAMLGIGFIASKAPLAILFGAVTMIVGAATLLAVGWLLSYMKDWGLGSIGKQITTGVLAPINGIIDVFKRLKNEIGISNILPLAIGIIGLAGSIMYLSAATAGMAVSGLISGIADSFKEFLGGEDSGPMEMIDKLANKSEKIKNLGDPLYNIGKGLGSILTFANSDIGNMSKLFDDLQKLNKGFKNNKGGIANLKSTMSGVKSSVNGLNVQKVEKTTKLIEAMHQLQKLGSQKSSIDKIGEKLIEAVKELSKVVEKMDQATSKDEQNNNNNNNSEIKQLINSIKSMVSQSGDNNQQTTNKDSEIVDAIENLENTLIMQGVKIKED